MMFYSGRLLSAEQLGQRKMQYELFKRFIEPFKPDALQTTARDVTQVLKAASEGRKLYVSTARGWRDRDSLLARCYAVDSFVDKPIKIVWAGDEGAKIQGRRLNNAFIDEEAWIYQFVNGEGMRMADLDPKPIEIELSLSDLVGEE